MAFQSKYKGKYITIDPKHPKALGICDYSDFVFFRKDLIKQMEWRGNSLVWTGLLVGKPFADVPNQQGRPPLVKNDPKPIRNPRIPQNTVQDTLNRGAPGIASSEVQVNYTDPEINPLPPYNQVLQKFSKISFITGNNPYE